MAEGSQKEFSDFEDEGLLPIMDMLNFKIVKMDHGDTGFCEGDKSFVTPDANYYAGEFCRLSEEVQHWKSACETKENKVAELEKQIQRLKKKNSQLEKKAKNLKEVESIMEEQQNILEALEHRQKKTEKNFEKELEEEKRKVELKDSMLVLLDTKLEKLKKQSQNTEKKLKDLSDFLINCNNSLEENINSFVSELNLTSSDDSGTSDKALETVDDQVHLKLKRNLLKLHQVVRKTFTEILKMGNEDNLSQSKNNSDQTNRITLGINDCENQQLWKPYEEGDDQYHPVCSPVTPEQCTIPD